MECGYASLSRRYARARPLEVLSFNQVNGVPRGFEPPASPSFRYVEVWPPNDKWRHLEGLLQRSAGAVSGTATRSRSIRPFGETERARRYVRAC